MSSSERRRCLENSIRVRRKYCSLSFAGRRAILIDDVMTSGATAEACSKALLASSCSSVMTVVAIRGRLNTVSFS
ncbi:hypothetical protein FAI40_00430 [Acetobacteraceae bacterium]|nr:hypothetical protein FAI40_00430 [Acetobacteraceae bacterium]